MSDDLRLNSIDRFRKRSERLVLEEHAHCEVPAGCGGVVLRWRNPDAGVPVVLYGGWSGESTIHVDGEVVTTGRTTLTYGTHVLAIALEGIDGDLPLFAFAAQVDDGEYDAPSVPALCSDGNGEWLASAEPPGDGWTADGFDAAGWQPLAEANVDVEQLPDRVQWRMGAIERRGGAILRLPAGDRVWIRRRFEVTR